MELLSDIYFSFMTMITFNVFRNFLMSRANFFFRMSTYVLETRHMFWKRIILFGVLIVLFLDLKFQSLNGKEVHSGNIEKVPIKEKSKFPQNFFPEVMRLYLFNLCCPLSKYVNLLNLSKIIKTQTIYSVNGREKVTFGLDGALMIPFLISSTSIYFTMLQILWLCNQ